MQRQVVSWVVLGGLLLFAQMEVTLLRLMTIKTEILAQLAPAFVLGCHCPSLTATPVLVGMVVGLGLVVACTLGDWHTVLGVYNGVWGLGLNLAVVAAIQRASRAQQSPEVEMTDIHTGNCVPEDAPEAEKNEAAEESVSCPMDSCNVNGAIASIAGIETENEGEDATLLRAQAT